MLNKGFRFFGQGSSKKFQVSSQRSPWPNILSMIGAARTNIVSHSLLLLRTTARQVESMARQRLRQYLWLRMLHTRLCHRMSAGRLVAPRWSGALAGGAVLCNKKTNFDWEKERVSPAESSNYFGHIDQCRVIREKTIICKECHNRLRIDKEVENVNYCRCKDAPASVYGQASEDCDWRPFIERKDILVWRREHGTMKGNYEYKMYGNFDDVSADEFLSVQLDMSEFRLSWDTNTAQCVVIDSEADTEEAIVYYWEVNWPRFFSNRDYCCYRQTAADPDTGALLVLSRSVDHPGCPSKRKTWRVQDYFSVLVIKPHTTSDQPGLEFCLTGYENPGLQLPESIITWVAHRGMPDFMMNLRSACLKLRGQDQRSQEAAAKESPKVYPENSSYQQPMGQGRMYA